MPALRRIVLLVLACAASLAALSCGMSRQEQLEQVAKDWCLTIRASQVIPVYPLTEDIQPGDVFLVQLTVDEQQHQYEKRGFLPLDNHIARLTPAGYDDFYRQTFLVPDGGEPPTLPKSLQRKPDGTSNWEAGLRAGFPSYSFTVSRSRGLNLAVPISGIPIGLSLLGAESARGSVTIDGARTLGLDIVSLYNDVQCWARDHRDFLAMYAPACEQLSPSSPPNYIRVISRVYLTGAVDIALSDARSFGGGADAGLARPVDLLSPRTPSGLDDQSAAIANYRSAIASTNAMLANATTPGRRSGMPPGLSPDEIVARTEAEQAALREERAARRQALEQAIAQAEPADNAALAAAARLEQAELELSEAQELLQQAQADADAMSELPEDHPQRVEAEERLVLALDALTDARWARQTARTEQAEALRNRAAARARLDFAQRGLDELSQFVPGGSLRVAAASSRFISLKQEFDPPLVIGYLAFDMEIRPGGSLGPPIPTHARLDPQLSRALIMPEQVPSVQSNNSPEAIRLREVLRDWYRDDRDRRRHADEQRRRMFPRSADDPLSFWLQGAGAADLRCLIETLQIEIPS